MLKFLFGKKPAIDVAATFREAGALHDQGRLVEAEPLCRAVIDAQPGHFDARHLLGVIRLQQGRHEEAAALIAEALKVKPGVPEALSNRGLALLSLHRLDEALQCYDDALALRPGYTDALFNRGIVQGALGWHDAALASFDAAIAQRPGFVAAHVRRGDTLQALGRHGEAIAGYDRALALDPAATDVHNNRGVAAHALGRYGDAVASYDRALATRPAFPEALNNRGNALAAQGRHDVAIASYDAALALRPDYADALGNRGNALAAQGCHDEAILAYDAALGLAGGNARNYYNRGNALHALGRDDEAVVDYAEALRLDPGYVEALNNRGLALHALGRTEAALADYDRALALRPGFVAAQRNRGLALRELGRREEAQASLEAVVAADPDFPYAAGDLAFTRALLCDWRDYARTLSDLAAGVAAGKPVIVPFSFLGMTGDPALQRQCAEIHARGEFAAVPRAGWNRQRYPHDRIRVAYLSADFRDHPVASLIVELIERHDRHRFEVLALSLGPDEEGALRSRLVAAFDRFIPLENRSDADAAALIGELEVDILVDLMGYTRGSRPGILARHPAPVQASWLGFPGTLGTDCIDYLLGDGIVTPAAAAARYAEHVVALPDSYMVIDTTRGPGEGMRTRAEAGLSVAGIVFCCFNNPYKITPPLWDIWMRLLHAVEGSVLWLRDEGEAVGRNLHAEAEARGVDPVRIVLAPRVSYPEYVARFRLADLFLDSLPSNAHTTASDALWAGLPVLTALGTTFAGRVGASLLHAAGLPEMIAADLRDYEDRALQLARQPALLAASRDRLARNRATAPLFDTDRFRRHIEAAYATMMECHLAGAEPCAFAVPRSDH